MRTIIVVVCSMYALLLSDYVGANPILVVDPIPTDPAISTQVNVNVSVTNLADEFVGDYDLSLFFDDSVLNFAGIFFGTALDGPGDSIQDFFDFGNRIDVFEISLSALFGQDGFTSFSLFSITFDVIGVGTSALDLGVNAIGDFFGLPLSVDVQNSSLTAVSPTNVPEPGTFILFAIASLGLMWSRKKSAGAQS